MKQAVRDLTVQQNNMQRLMIEQRDLMNALVSGMNQPQASPPTSSVTPPAASVPVSQVNVPLSVPLGASGTRQASGGQGSQKLSDKPMPPMPKADSENWSTRPLEVLGFRRYCESIISWLCLLDPAYSDETAEVFRRTTPVPFASMNAEQVLRSQRLFHIIKQSQSASLNSRWDILVRLYEAQSMGAGEPNNGYELLRMLRMELGLKTRSECLYFKSSVLEFRFLDNCDLQDNLRRLDAEVFRYHQMVDTFVGDPALIHDMRLQDSDLYQLLIQCLSGDAKLYVQLNAPETFAGAKQACQIFYQRTVLSSQDLKKSTSLSLAELGKPKPDMSSITCWKCGKKGHFAKDCRVKVKQQDGKGQGETKGPKGKGKEKGKEKGSRPDQKGKSGKKGDKNGKGKDKGKPKGKRSAEWLESDAWSEHSEWQESSVPTASEQPSVSSKGAADANRLCGLVEVFVEAPQHCLDRAHAEPEELEKLEKGLGKPKVSFADELGVPCASWEENRDEEAHLWLLDSGASRSVVNEKFLKYYTIVRERHLEQPIRFFTASGEEAQVNREVVLEAWFWLWEGHEHHGGHFVKRRFELRCLVSKVQHNLLSMGQVCKQGWECSMSEHGTTVRWMSWDFLVDMWGACPWLSAVSL